MDQDPMKEWHDYKIQEARKNYRNTLVECGMSEDQADKLAGMVPPVKTDEGIEDPALQEAREDYRDTLVESARPREEANRMAGLGES